MNSIKCWNCNLVNFATVTHCRRCKNELSGGTTGQSEYYGYNPQPNQTSNPYSVDQTSMPNAYSAPVNPAPYNETGYNSPYNGTQNDQTGYGSPYGGTPNNQTGYGAPYGGTPTGTVFSENAAYMPPNPYASYAPPAKLKQGLAIASLTIGLVGLFICFLGMLGSIPGLICGIKAVRKANRNPMEYGGKGMAIAGIVINSLLLLMIPIIAAIAIPNLLAARKAANEAAALRTLHTLSSAEATYQSTTGGGTSYGTLEDLERAGLIKVGTALNSGYKFKVIVSNCTIASAKNCRPHFVVLGTPITYGSTGTGKRSFYLDETGVIRADDRVGMDADGTAPPLPSAPSTPYRPSSPYDDED
jgi:type IV pilus assembly protein PilA